MIGLRIRKIIKNTKLFSKWSKVGSQTKLGVVSGGTSPEAGAGASRRSFETASIDRSGSFRRFLRSDLKSAEGNRILIALWLISGGYTEFGGVRRMLAVLDDSDAWL